MQKAVFILLAGMMFAFGLLPRPAAAQSSHVETIAVVVNDDAVSESDVMDRLKLVIASSGMPDNKEIRDRIMPQVLNVLIEEKLKLQEAARDQIDVTDEDLAQGFAAIAGQNNFSPDQFRAVLGKAGVSVKTLEDQIRAQIAWSKVVQQKLQPQIIVADNEVDSVVERMKASEGKSEYRVSEIFLPVESPGDESNVKALADKLTRQLVDGHVPFPRLAAQFSKAPGASNGGDMGWVQQGQLPAELDSMLGRMKEGELSKPVRTLSGFHILYLRGKRTVSEASIPSRPQIMNNIGMERLDRMQRSLLLDLKAAAFIDRRV